MKEHHNIILSKDEIEIIIKWIKAERKLIYDGKRTAKEAAEREDSLEPLEDKLISD